MFEFQLPKEFKNRRTKLAFKEDIEFHEILLDSLTQKADEGGGVARMRLEVPLLRRILRGFFIFCFIVISLLFMKTFQLQIFEGNNFAAMARDNKFVFQQTQAERGVIYDSNSKQLVFNKPSFDLILNVQELPEEEDEKNRILREIASIIKKDFESIKNELNKSNEGIILLAENLPHEELIILESKIRDFPGIEIQNNPVRQYADGEIFSHILGYIGKITGEEWRESSYSYSVNDYVGRSGVEKSYEEALRKNGGQIRIERDVRGNVISKEVVSQPTSGKSLVLWLDADLQRKVNEELKKQIDALGAKKGVAVAMDPKTGGILAMVSLPSFDNNLFQKGADVNALNSLLEDKDRVQPLFNRAISGKYLTGSTIKPLLASAALQEKIISPQKEIYSPGYIEVPNRYNPEAAHIFKDWTIHGRVDMRRAIAQSSNVFFYSIGGGYKDQAGLGPTRIKNYLSLFGWVQKTGIDLPGEVEGFIPDIQWKKEVKKENWWDGDTYNLSIGQGFVQITPLEVITSIAAIANGGKLLQPQVVKKIVGNSSGSQETVEEMQTKIIREGFIDPANLQIVREGMRHAVSGEDSPLASAIMLNSLPVKAAAKTGTAELGANRYNNWVTVFAPYEDPQIILTIMLEDVRGVHAAAVPVSKNVLEWYFTNRGK